MNITKTTDDGNASTRRFSDMPSTTTPTYKVHFLLPSDDGDYVLAETGPNNQARLTKAIMPIEDDTFFLIIPLQGKVQEVFSFPVYFAKHSYRCVEEDMDSPGRDVYHDMWIVHPAGDFPVVKEPIKWIHRDDLSSYKWVNEIRLFRQRHTAEDINYFLDDCMRKEEERAKPWEALGFYKKLMSWAIGVLKNNNMIMEGRIEFLQDGSDGRIFTTCGARVRDKRHAVHATERSEMMFIKSTFPQAREVERTVAVASMFQNIVPEIVGLDVARGILMQRGAGKMNDDPFDQILSPTHVTYSQRCRLETSRLSANLIGYP